MHSFSDEEAVSESGLLKSKPERCGYTRLLTAGGKEGRTPGGGELQDSCWEGQHGPDRVEGPVLPPGGPSTATGPSSAGTPEPACALWRGPAALPGLSCPGTSDAQFEAFFLWLFH